MTVISKLIVLGNLFYGEIWFQIQK